MSRSLLSSCPAIAILATSREPIRVPGERQHHVPPLSLPEGVPDPETLVGSAAGRLFVDRARSVAPGFEVTADNVA
ncbi:MAG: hypothetical protein GWN07_32470, partial [Actinobacteria bacterium]|nr:hypothetical protein [Actinomycetota bacterium]NIS35466.1 hypothetical protein [Actinomycetota bacterium]NIU70135.1 hypothetical protein [Actinomycetota bacterium]NIW32019.1 hypothetical protein [Actinomycetota bacterium]NIX24272.1 hypothetical protein [Actinomycetota bacterium]